MSAPFPLVLASTSRYRAELLRRLGLEFTSFAPRVDEAPWPGETPDAMVRRLSLAKAEAARVAYPAHLVIASDQCAVHSGAILGKPGTPSRAEAQLARFSGDVVEFLTGLCVLNTATGNIQLDVVPFRVHFRRLTSDQIARYVHAETPLDCAGSFKSEGLGITLFERLEGDDPNALIGLPLIRLTDFLNTEGLALP
ncbi:MAG: Maf family protein [Thiotrichales bacterium]